MPFIPHTPEEAQEMLAAVGVSSFDELFADIPPELKPKSFDLPPGLPETDVMRRMEALAAKNDTAATSFLGAGYYNHAIPKAVDYLTGRGEFYTAYTPYQAECSQGTLQAIFEYQTAVCRLMDMDCANASVYDGGTALFEGLMMAVRHTKRKKLVVDAAMSPVQRAMLDTYTLNLGLDIVTVAHNRGMSDMAALIQAVDKDTAAVAVQNPNFFGCVADFAALFEHTRAVKALGVISVYPVLQSVLKTPGEMGADIAVGEGQSLGMPLSFGGPYLGIMTCKKSVVRQLPGRIAGRTTDKEGRTGYVLTLQAREQHIRRAKATSNICSNQALCAMRAMVHMALLGPSGLQETAERCIERAHYAAERLCDIPGVDLMNEAPFGNEFALNLPMNAEKVVEAMAAKCCIPGFPLGKVYPDMGGMDNALLVACTGQHDSEQIGMMADMMTKVLGGHL